MNKKLVLATVLLAVLGNIESSFAAEDVLLSPASKVYKQTRELEDQRRQAIREKIRESRLKKQQDMQSVLSKKAALEKENTALEKEKTAIEKEKNRLDILRFLKDDLRQYAANYVLNEQEKLNNIIETSIIPEVSEKTEFEEADIQLEINALANKINTASIETQRKIGKTSLDIDLADIEIESVDIFKSKLNSTYTEFFEKQKRDMESFANKLFLDNLEWKSLDKEVMTQELLSELKQYDTGEHSAPVLNTSSNPDAGEDVDFEAELEDK